MNTINMIVIFHVNQFNFHFCKKNYLYVSLEKARSTVTLILGGERINKPSIRDFRYDFRQISTDSPNS